MPQGMAPAGASLPAASVPDSESLRRALLRASWQRDQEVGSRRLRQRWAAWAAQRIGLAALIAGALGWTFVSLRPETVDGAMARLMSFGAPAAGTTITDAAPAPVTSATSGAPAASAATDTPSAEATATAASAAAPATEAAAHGDQAPQMPRPALRLDLDVEPSVAPTRNQPQPSTPGDTRT